MELPPQNKDQNFQFIADIPRERPSEATSNEYLINYYLDSVTQELSGPQLEGLNPTELEEVLKDDRTKYINIYSEILGKNIALPFLTPVEHAGWINHDFLTKSRYDPNKIMYCILPQKLLNEKANPDDIEKCVDELIDEDETVSVLIDYPQNVKPEAFTFQMPHTTDLLFTGNGSPAATYHYETICSQQIDAFNNFKPDPSIVIIKPKEVDKYFERIWEIYSVRFKDLVEDHPIAGALSKETLLATLQSDATHVHAYFDDNHQIQSFGYLVEDLSLCPWLNREYFQKEAGGKPLVYMPGIASSPKTYTLASTKIMSSMLYERLKKTPEFMLTFECSNKSAEYIPRLVKRVLDNSGLVKQADFKEFKHYYQVLNFKRQP